jgi:hypothetical protein
VNGVLTAVRGMVVHAAATGRAPGDLVPLLYEVADDRDLPGQARDGDGRMSWRLRTRHRLREPETRVDRASDEEIVVLLAASPVRPFAPTPPAAGSTTGHLVNTLHQRERQERGRTRRTSADASRGRNQLPGQPFHHTCRASGEHQPRQ